jgi:hypothetical protein
MNLEKESTSVTVDFRNKLIDFISYSEIHQKIAEVARTPV